jgi:hypothetical protein
MNAAAAGDGVELGRRKFTAGGFGAGQRGTPELLEGETVAAPLGNIGGPIEATGLLDLSPQLGVGLEVVGKTLDFGLAHGITPGLRRRTQLSHFPRPAQVLGASI